MVKDGDVKVHKRRLEGIFHLEWGEHVYSFDSEPLYSLGVKKRVFVTCHLIFHWVRSWTKIGLVVTYTDRAYPRFS